MALSSTCPAGISLALALCLGLAAPAVASPWGNRDAARQDARGGDRYEQHGQERRQQHQPQAVQRREAPQRNHQQARPDDRQRYQNQLAGQRHHQQQAERERSAHRQPVPQRQQAQPQDRQRLQQQSAQRLRENQQRDIQRQHALQQERQRHQNQQQAERHGNPQRQAELQRQQLDAERYRRQLHDRSQPQMQQHYQQRHVQQHNDGLNRDRQRHAGNHQQVAHLTRNAAWHSAQQRRNHLHNQTQYKRPYRPVYSDRPWYGWHGSRRPHSHGPVVVYRNIHHYVTIPQPVYVHHVSGYSYNDYYYSGPYAGYDSVYRYDSYGYGHRYSACNSDAVGAAIGAVLGGVIGADQGRGAGPVVGGALIGAVLGGVLGSLIDSSNQACVGDVLEYMPANQPVYWQDPHNGYGYEVTPLRTYEPQPGQYCREYQTVVTIGGRAEQAYGYACRQPDGSWQTVNS